MSKQYSSRATEQESSSSRRQFLGNTLAAVSSAPLLGASMVRAAEDTTKKAESTVPMRKIKLGLVGCGGRGGWIGKLFKEHGGYEMHALADYFPDVADNCGVALGVEKERRFSGLSGYKRVIESGAEAVALIVPPGFLPEHASAAAEAGLHVYMAKPVAVDVPGCLLVESAGKVATRKQQVFFVDYQMPYDPVNIQVAKRVWNGEMGTLAKVSTLGVSGGHADPPLTKTIASRLQHLTWANDIALGGDFILSYDVHAIDAAIWLLGRHPVTATGFSRVCRPDPHGDAHDICSVLYEYGDGLLHEHSGMSLPNSAAGELNCRLYGPTANALVSYGQKARFHRRGDKPFEEQVVDLYPLGAKRNIASFHADVTAGKFENPTVRRAVDGCLTGILGREAAARHGLLTMEELLKENRRIELDVRGLKT